MSVLDLLGYCCRLKNMQCNDCSHDSEVCYQDVVVANETDSDALAEICSTVTKIVKGKS